ncbi:glycosyltransferase family protein [Pantoea sp. BAV 3049]|uniref:glycosyltransferase family protein n=1 Tax=Pantoea sp. BAV 3049 TaxID=2654188 RepID=UPI0018EECB59|nr:glycosyltransferase family protein [Pantoea sp. BAV 3049]
MESSANKKRAPRCVLYSHDTMGFGHIRRNILLSQAVLDALPNAEVLLISGVREAGRFTLRKGVDSVILPSYIKTPEGKYQPRSLGKKIKSLVRLREQIIYSAINAFSPDVMIVDNVPRGAMRELDLSLPLLSRLGTHMVLGLRDIIDEPQAVKKQWDKQENSQAIRDFYSTIWIYGDKKLYDLRKEYHFDAQTNKKINFTGYLDSAQRTQSDDNDGLLLGNGNLPYVLCVVGGGQDGFHLAETFARARLPEGVQGILVTGSMMPEAQRLRLQQLVVGSAEKSIVGFMAEPLKLLRNARAVVAMGGYNTVTEILTFHKTALIVPRVSPRLEQWLRAERLARMGLLDCVHPDHLTVDYLSNWLAGSHRFADPRERLDFSGLNFVAESVRGMLSSERSLSREEAS